MEHELIEDSKETERLKHELSVIKGRLKQLEHVAHIGSWQWDIRCNKVIWSEGTHAIFGTCPGGTYEDYLKRVHPEDLKMVTDAITAALEKNTPYNIDHRIIRTDGTTITVHCDGEVIRDKKTGTPRTMFGTTQNITLRKRLEIYQSFLADFGKQLSESIDFSATLQQVGSAAIPAFANWSAVYLLEKNSVRIALLRHSDKQKLLQMKRCIGSEVPALCKKLIYRSMARGRAILLPMLSNYGLEPQQFVMAPMIAHGRRVGAIAFGLTPSQEFDKIARNLYSEYAFRSALALDNSLHFQDAQKATRSREEIVAIVSHDLQNPVSAIQLNVDFLKKTIRELGIQNKNISRVISAVEESLRQMKTLISDLLDFARNRAGNLQFEMEAVDPTWLITQYLEIIKPLADKKEVELTLTVPSHLPELRCNPDRVKQVLSNLVGNAIKFTPKGGRISILLEELDRFVRFVISDTGPGIPPEDMERIFEMYSEPKRRASGAGLGLTIAKAIVEAQSGSIGVESQEGKGSRFWFTIPKLSLQSGHDY
ncbi:MAG: hypothetical protein A2Z97_15575 [Bdellovibrionales bacterium GWB1_52_6]|nr:MAG: hypothetical protein A2Z97_15575 [Bdellovibrionales bacterium GWB1_52_6]OFZ02910.1 MAG: hypothetical protein A2X97_04880 [Bdellovibrionales bacterium GWA1_52_35]HCM38493.1 hypothetical protein [Bdellovibrionales bacterium]